MKANAHKATSRPLAVAQALVNGRIEPNAVYARRVALIGEQPILATRNGRWCFLDALMLLSRVVGHLVVVVPLGMDDLNEEVTALCRKTWSVGSLTVVREIASLSLESYDAILNVGTVVRTHLPWTSINSNGWVARIASGARPLPGDTTQANPLGALMAASCGAAEVFKRIFSVPPDTAPPLDYCELSLFELTTTPNGPGPALPEFIQLPDALVIGGGAIGNGIALLLSQLPVHGRMHLVDKQQYADENFGTCVLLEKESWLDQPKAIRLAKWLSQNSGLDVTGERELIEIAISGDIIRSLNIDLVLNGLDDVSARRESQRLWPSILIDGGINEVGAAVFQHRLDRADFGCLRCWFQEPVVDERAMQSKWTGLHANSLSNSDRVLTEDDIVAAAEHKQEWLRECRRQGKTVCSVITEAQLASRLDVEARDGFRPSVPFVATASAALVMSEALKSLLFPDGNCRSLFQLGNLFLGPDVFVLMQQTPVVSCICSIHRTTIERLQRERRTRVERNRPPKRTL